MQYDMLFFKQNYGTVLHFTGRSREVYHTKRMQRIFCVCWSSDATYVMSGSDETNIRLWKAEASEKLGKLRPREMAARRYAAQLRHRYLCNMCMI